MKLSPAGRKKLIAREGARLKAYKDSVGVWTIGIGHTAAAGPPTPQQGLTITADECSAIFARDIGQYERAVDKAVTVPMTQGEFDALVSLCFNIGTGAFARSTVVKKLNADDRPGAATAFMLWNKPPEIIGRRRGERDQFVAGGRSRPDPAEEPVEQRQPDDPGPEPDDTKPHAAPKDDSKTGITEGAKVGIVATIMGFLAQAWEVISSAPDTILQAVVGMASKPAFWAFVVVGCAIAYVWWRRSNMKKAA